MSVVLRLNATTFNGNMYFATNTGDRVRLNQARKEVIQTEWSKYTVKLDPVKDKGYRFRTFCSECGDIPIENATTEDPVIANKWFDQTVEAIETSVYFHVCNHKIH